MIKKYKKEIFIILITYLLLFITDVFSIINMETKVISKENKSFILSKLEHGDLLIITSEDFTSKIFQKLNKNHKVSTIKIVVELNNKFYLIESNGDNLSENNTGLILTNLDIVLSEYDDLSITLYRPKKNKKTNERINELLRKINSNKKYGYDYSYNNYNYDTFTCIKTAIYVYEDDFINMEDKGFFKYESFDNVKYDNMELIINHKKIK